MYLRLYGIKTQQSQLLYLCQKDLSGIKIFSAWALKFEDKLVESGEKRQIPFIQHKKYQKTMLTMKIFCDNILQV